MKSLGIAINGQPNEAVELHMNIWKSHPGFFSMPHVYIDFGIKARISVNRIRIFLPFRLNKSEPWKDLGSIMAEHGNILCAIFNHDYNVTHKQESCFHEVRSCMPGSGLGRCRGLRARLGNLFHRYRKSKFGTNLFYLYPLGHNNVSVKEDPDNNGTIIDIAINNPKSISSDSVYYIRFRVHLADYREFIKKKDISNDLIQSAFSKLDIFDISINESRDLNKTVKEILSTEGFNLARFSKAHIFYITTPKVKVESGSHAKADSRLIEEDMWEAYEPDNKTHCSYIAHHWLHRGKDENLGQIRLFFTAQYPKIQFFTLLEYLSVLILSGALGSWLASTDNPSSVNADSTNHFPVWWKLVIAGSLIVYIIVRFLWTRYGASLKIYKKV